ncbi:DEAD/DEAH box helicase [Paenibacillus woosongensis]|uniref:RNA helicase n=1 Tax=Paenibacillus woosongensis TaxID=307580 RepID=A0ABQ4MS04_9BACL|nr:DEAD/DEAH box helicase [Paenibacillus woosongensis]GIP58718.1 DEAD-box ATP-dependent RNA helicase CshE [Paenibacillus woosongensis]
MTTFDQWGISPELIRTLQHHGISTPTPVQEEAIPVLLAGEDAIVQAQTGTGKTLAFLLPIMDKLKADRPDPQALIITPTRELAIQITAEARKLAAAREGISILAAYGGQDVERQLRKLHNGTQLVIGTPGRLLDHLRRGSLTLGAVRMLVLDEADQMLHMGFLAEVEAIIHMVPKNRQTMLFSATMPDNVKRLARSYMDRPRDIRIAETSRVTLDSIRQILVECTDRGKQGALIELIRTHRPYLAVIFCRTKRRASKLNEALQEAGFASDELHGDLSQSKREQVMRAFRDAKLELLVATDVAARGIDVEGVTHVFNYDIPQDVDSYIHRIGRTGRAGGKGVAITFASPRDIDALRHIERGIGMKLERRRQEKSETAASVSRDTAGKRESKDSAGKGRRPEGRKPAGGRADEGRRGQGSGKGSRERQSTRSTQARGAKPSNTRSGHASRSDSGGRRGRSERGGRRGR